MFERWCTPSITHNGSYAFFFTPNERHCTNWSPVVAHRMEGEGTRGIPDEQEGTHGEIGVVKLQQFGRQKNGCITFSALKPLETDDSSPSMRTRASFLEENTHTAGEHMCYHDIHSMHTSHHNKFVHPQEVNRCAANHLHPLSVRIPPQ